MADAIRTNREEESHRVSGFSLMEPVGKLGAYPKRMRSFLHDVRVEMKQVNWPSRSDVMFDDGRGDRDGGFFCRVFLVYGYDFKRLYISGTDIIRHN